MKARGPRQSRLRQGSLQPGRLYQIKEVARLSKVSVRALHHYDEIGLLVPSQRSAAGYRKYDDRDLLRLQQILIRRELGLPLEEIRRCLDDPEFDQRQALLSQREQLRARAPTGRQKCCVQWSMRSSCSLRDRWRKI